jgi:hypothetical protein
MLVWKWRKALGDMGELRKLLEEAKSMDTGDEE